MNVKSILVLCSLLAANAAAIRESTAQELPVVSLGEPIQPVVLCAAEAPTCTPPFWGNSLTEESLNTAGFILWVDGEYDTLHINLDIGGTATNGIDYEELPVTWQLDNTGIIDLQGERITPYDDTEIEGDETVVITLLEGDGYRVTESSNYRLTIPLIDDDFPEPDFFINPGLNDAWFDPAVDDQGFIITVFPESEVMLVSWFTYELAPRVEGPDGVTLIGDDKQRWFSAQGPYDGATATLDVYSTNEGGFGEKKASRRKVGKMVIVWEDCENADLTFEVETYNGVSSIQRIVTDNVALCEMLNSELQQIPTD